MKIEKTIHGKNDDQVFEQIGADFAAEPDMLTYNISIDQNSRKIFLTIDIDPGGGFEGGFETTTLWAPLQSSPQFRFAIHHESIIDEIGKFFGMQDVVTGYPEFDKKVVVKTNDEEKVKSLFESAAVRTVFSSLTDFTFGTTKHNTEEEHKAPFLEFTINSGITDAIELKKIYSAFMIVLNKIDPATE